jgi:dihydroorotate dehydrogenase (fumarate)
MNLETSYLGFRLRSPLVPSASPLTGNLDNLCRLEDAGAAAVVLPSLFQEQIEGRFDDPSWSLRHGIEPYPADLSYLPKEEDFLANPESHLDRIRKASSRLTIPVIASLSGAGPGEWMRYARRMEEAGADAIELSIFQVPTEIEVGAGEIEDSYARMVASARQQVSIPLAVKIGPAFTSLPNFARRLAEAGADGLVLFNRLFNADIDLEHGAVIHTIRWTTSRDIQLPLRGAALLHDRVKASLAVSSGVHAGADALKLIHAGADVTMLCSSLMIHGIQHLKIVEAEMTEWLERRGHVSLEQIRGSLSLAHCPARSACERANYLWSVGDFVSEIQRPAL